MKHPVIMKRISKRDASIILPNYWDMIHCFHEPIVSEASRQSILIFF